MIISQKKLNPFCRTRDLTATIELSHNLITIDPWIKICIRNYV